MPTGYIVRVLRDRGFGFIKPDVTGSDIFFHSDEVTGDVFNDLNAGDRVSYDFDKDRRGRTLARNVKPL